MISSLRGLFIGNAVRIVITPGDGAEMWRVLRRTADAFTGPLDTGAVVVGGSNTSDNVLIDTDSLENGTVYFYHAWDYIAGQWVDAGPSQTVTPASSYADDGVDPQAIVIERVRLALVNDVAQGRLTPQSGVIEVTDAPFALSEGINFPTVSIHVDGEAPEVRGLGDEPFVDDDLDPISGLAETTHGWMNRVRLNIVAGSYNADERAALRRAIRRAIQGNIGVFSARGMTLPEYSQNDFEEFTAQNLPAYYTAMQFTCLAPSFVTASTGADVREIDVAVSSGEI